MVNCDIKSVVLEVFDIMLTPKTIKKARDRKKESARYSMTTVGPIIKADRGCLAVGGNWFKYNQNSKEVG